jgi:hypothetical protein
VGAALVERLAALGPRVVRLDAAGLADTDGVGRTPVTPSAPTSLFADQLCAAMVTPTASMAALATTPTTRPIAIC